MNTPEWLKPGIYGAIVGVVAIGIVGFSWGGWMTGSSADEMASEMSHSSVISALVPVCLEKSANDSDRFAKMATIREASTYKRRDAVMDAGWATMPGTESADRDLAQACLSDLKIDAS
jgi:dienelactone hydrolase